GYLPAVLIQRFRQRPEPAPSCGNCRCSSRTGHADNQRRMLVAQPLISVATMRPASNEGTVGMNLARELRHKSEDIDDLVLADVVRAIGHRVRTVRRDYDIPYIAGYSVDGHTVFIDRHLPRTFRWLMKAVAVEPFLLTHEIVEKSLLDELRLHYLHAHQIALRAERDAVRAAGVSWQAYQRFMKQHEKHIAEEKLIKVPTALDLTPYRDEKDFGLLQRLVRREHSSTRRRQAA